MATIVVVITNPDVEPDILKEDTEVLFATERDFNTSTVSFATVQIVQA